MQLISMEVIMQLILCPWCFMPEVVKLLHLLPWPKHLRICMEPVKTECITG